jgi:putative transposase
VPLLEKKGLSVRESCALLSVCRSGRYYQARPNAERESLRQVVREEALRHPTYGYRRIAWRLKTRRGLVVHASRVYRLWRLEGLALPPRRKKRNKRVGQGEQPPPRALYPNHVWTYDFVKVRLRNGGYLRILVLLDEFTRECLGFYIARSIPASKVLSFLQGVIASRGGGPEYLRSDNGPEFIESCLNAWLKEQGTRPVFITPGSPWENGKCESFNGKFRAEFLDRHVHFSLKMLQIQAEWWRSYYNRERPHSALDYQTPAAFAQAWYHEHRQKTQDTQATQENRSIQDRETPRTLALSHLPNKRRVCLLPQEPQTVSPQNLQSILV